MTTIRLRRGTATQWASAATVLAAGEPGLETDTGILKLGDGVTAWASLNPVLSGTYVRRSMLSGNRTLIFGDSIMSHGSDEATSTTQGYYDRQGVIWAAQLSLGQRLTVVANKATSGDTSTMMLARFQADILAYAGQVDNLVMDGGANDINNVSLATTKANLTTMWQLAAAAGMRVFYFTLNPSSNYSATATSTSPVSGVYDAYAFNRWVRRYAAANPGYFVLVDCWARLIDLTSTTQGQAITGLISDSGVHPNFYGTAIMGRALAEAMEPYVQGLPAVAEGSSDPANVIANPCLSGSSGTLGNGSTGAAPTSWTLNGNGSAVVATSSVLSRSDGVQGQWWQVKAYSAVSQIQLLQLGQGGIFGATLNIGDSIEAIVEMETDFDCADLYALNLLVQNQAGTAIGRGYLYPSGDGVQTGYDAWPRKLWFKTPAVVIPAATTRVDFFITIKPPATAANTGVTLRVGRVRLSRVGV